jgi:hypothetical protein
VTATACAFCGLPVALGNRAPRGRSRARMDLDPPACAECSTLEPGRPGALLRAAARVLGADEADPHLLKALADDDDALDGLLYSDPAEPLIAGRRAPQSEPWAHVPALTRDALRRARARGLELRLAVDCAPPAEKTAPPSGPAGCLVCGAATSASWRRVTTAALTRGPELVEGHLCGACQLARDKTGAVGPSLVERAALTHAGVTRPEEMTVPGLTAWVAAGEPAGEPWGWIDLRVPGPEPAVRDLLAEVAALRSEVEALKEARL